MSEPVMNSSIRILVFAVVLFGLPVAASSVLARRLANDLFNVGPLDVITLITVTGGMVLIAIGASYWPARTVTHQVPGALLKNE